MSRQGCKGCSASVYLSPGDIYEIIRDAEAKTRDELVAEEIYKSRLEVCQECPDLLYNTTCRYSGYLVYVLAREKKASCQKPGEKKWQAVY
ncbi:MAG: hypothetical protein GX336_05575 [Halanaerobiaceae bacterium]|nr:hypothetical protein [Halanaerobiaceae bacterium]